MSYTVRSRNNESYGEALARELGNYITSNGTFIDRRTKEGRKIKEVREAMRVVEHYIQRTKGMREVFYLEGQ